MPGTRPGMTSFAVRFCRKRAIPARIRKPLGKRKGGSSMLPPQDSLPNQYQAFENSWSTYSQFTR